MKEVPDMDHLGPDLKIDINVGGTRGFGKGERVIKQGLGSTDLDQ